MDVVYQRMNVVRSCVKHYGIGLRWLDMIVVLNCDLF